jgi:hypothetical protein
MAEEEKIIPKQSLLKGFFGNPLGWIVSGIAVGSFFFHAGSGSADSKNAINRIESKVDKVSNNVDKLNYLVNDHIEMTKNDRADFSVLENNYIEDQKLVNRLDKVIKYYEEKSNAEKLNEEKKKSGTTQLNLSSQITNSELDTNK